MPLTRAREVANDARKTAANGGTPLAPKAGRAGTERKAKSYGEVVEVYYAERLTSLRTGPATRTTLQRIGRVYRWNERPIASISDDDAAAMLADIHAMFKWESLRETLSETPGERPETAQLAA